MNKFDKRIAITPERVGESLRQTVEVTIPFDEKIVPMSINRGIPFITDSKSQPIGKSILVLADVVREKLAKQQETEPNPVKK